MREADEHRPVTGRFRRFFAVLGPGLISGAADDDPSSIGTYSVVGAQFGNSVLWTAFITWPLIAAIQMMCTRIGWVTGRGLACALCEKFPRPLVAAAALGLLVANTITVGADLSAMADPRKGSPALIRIITSSSSGSSSRLAPCFFAIAESRIS